MKQSVKLFLAKGVGRHKEKLFVFEDALRNAENYSEELAASMLASILGVIFGSNLCRVYPIPIFSHDFF